VNPHGEAITRCFFTFSSAQSSVPCPSLPGSEQAPVHVSGSVTGLIAGTTYGFRIVAMNPSGTTYGAVQTLTTPGAPSFQPPAAAPPQTPSGALPPPLAPAVIASTTVRSSSSGVVGVKVSCPTAYPVCAGTIVLRTLRAVNASGHGKKRVLLLAAGPFKLTGGHSSVVKLRLATKARALLRHAHQLRARASIAFADATGAVHTTQTIVTIRLVAQRGH